jgi:hypothetical protein
VDGRRLALVTMPDGRPGSAWTEESTLVFATWNGTAWAREIVHTLPRVEEGTTVTFGLGIDMVVWDGDGQPALCLVDGILGPSDGEVSGLGTLRVIKRDPAGTWVPVAEHANVRPLGCSITNYLGALAVGWIEREGDNPNEFYNARAKWGLVGPLGLYTVGDIPIPSEAVVTSPLVHDLTLFGTASRLYFTYRTSHYSWRLPRAAGTIVVGYFYDGLVARSFAQVVCAPGEAPRVRDVVALPAASVVATEGFTEPPPLRSMNSTWLILNPFFPEFATSSVITRT